MGYPEARLPLYRSVSGGVLAGEAENELLIRREKGEPGKGKSSSFKSSLFITPISLAVIVYYLPYYIPPHIAHLSLPPRSLAYPNRYLDPEHRRCGHYKTIKILFSLVCYPTYQTLDFTYN